MESIRDRLAREHRELDERLGRFLAAGSPGEARDALAAFDDELRRHTAFEESVLFPEPDGDSAAARLSRELRLEHAQVRELSGMMRRLVEERQDFEGARRLFPNLARRWDAHTLREEAALADGSLSAGARTPE